MNPSMSLLNLTPSSSAVPSPKSGIGGALVGLNRLVQGQSPCTTLIVIPGPAASRLPLSSIARVRRIALPSDPGVQSYLQLGAPVAGCQVLPLSTETSTPATAPPPTSVADPLIVRRAPLGTEAAGAGDTMVETGANMSLVCAVVISGRVGSAPACSVPGATPMSVNR